jgi:hypothetical protein
MGGYEKTTMNESFLHYIWEFQYFDKKNLCTTEGESIFIFATGLRNTNAGPDFFNARIKIGEVEWIGNVEIHIYSSGWNDHHHDTDPSYENVILHVVWSDDKPVIRKDQSRIQTIELKNLVDPALIFQYKKLINNPGTIPCAASLKNVSQLTQLSMLDKALMHRLEFKSKVIHKSFERNQHDWEETCYQALARNFGFKINTEPFEQLSRALPYKILMKHASSLDQIEALIFGVAGFLNLDGSDEYYALLKREYTLLKRKFDLESELNHAQWKFLRLRPANFPSLRLAQFAGLLFVQKNIFSKILTAESYIQMRLIFSINQSVYWQKHYHFFKTTSDSVPSLGESSIDNILINTVVPLLVAYGKARDEQRYVDRAVNILQDIKAEDNTIIKNWKNLKMNCATAFDSQALLELHNNFCMKRRCLECTIGFSLLKPVL